MKVKETEHGRAIERENDLARKYIMGMERIPKIRGIIRKSLSGFSNG